MRSGRPVPCSFGSRARASSTGAGHAQGWAPCCQGLALGSARAKLPGARRGRWPVERAPYPQDLEAQAHPALTDTQAGQPPCRRRPAAPARAGQKCARTSKAHRIKAHMGRAGGARVHPPDEDPEQGEGVDRECRPDHSGPPGRSGAGPGSVSARSLPGHTPPPEDHTRWPWTRLPGRRANRSPSSATPMWGSRRAKPARRRSPRRSAKTSCGTRATARWRSRPMPVTPQAV